MYKHFRNIVSNYIAIANREYYTSVIVDNMKKHKLMSKYLKETLAGKCKSNIIGVLADGQNITDAMCKANAFNMYFTSNGLEFGV